jgi:hypothetical protein
VLGCDEQRVGAYMRRKGEPPGGRAHFRSDRFIQTNGSWYFTTREHIDVGPFRSRDAAVRASEILIAQLRDQADPAEAKKTIDDFVHFQVPRFNR